MSARGCAGPRRGCVMSDDLLAGRYRRVGPLGRGAMGEVWLAEDLVLGRRVAIKTLRTDDARGVDSVALDRMVREARVAARLRHKHAVAVFDLVGDEGQPHVVMEYVDGESLAERLRRVRRLEPAEAAKLIGEVAGALEEAHKIGIVHRDIKPGNILIDSAGEARLADFGIARGIGDSVLTSTGETIGTVAYMAPEVARGEEASFASDIWSLGATLYAAVEGRAPHQREGGSNTAQILVRLVTEPVPPPQHAGDFTSLLMAMLDTDPSVRPTSGGVARRLISGDAVRIETPTIRVDEAPTAISGAHVARQSSTGLANLGIDEAWVGSDRLPTQTTSLYGSFGGAPPLGSSPDDLGVWYDFAFGTPYGQRRIWRIATSVIVLGLLLVQVSLYHYYWRLDWPYVEHFAYQGSGPLRVVRVLEVILDDLLIGGAALAALLGVVRATRDQAVRWTVTLVAALLGPLLYLVNLIGYPEVGWGFTVRFNFGFARSYPGFMQVALLSRTVAIGICVIAIVVERHRRASQGSYDTLAQ